MLGLAEEPPAEKAYQGANNKGAYRRARRDRCCFPPGEGASRYTDAPLEDCVDLAHAYALVRGGVVTTPRAACAQISLNNVACCGARKTRTRSIARCTPLHASRALYCFHAPGLVQCRQEAPLAPAPSHAVRHVAKHMVAAALLLAGPPVKTHEELSSTFLADVGISAGLAPHNSTGQACVATDVVSVYAGIRVNAATGGGPGALFMYFPGRHSVQRPGPGAVHLRHAGPHGYSFPSAGIPYPSLACVHFPPDCALQTALPG